VHLRRTEQRSDDEVRAIMRYGVVRIMAEGKPIELKDILQLMLKLLQNLFELFLVLA
jgi:hypothetical protein